MPPSLLQLIWLSSPALPIGAFSYSEGMEAAVEAGRVTDEATACAWLTDQLCLAQGQSDIPVVLSTVQAARAGDTQRVIALDAWIRRTRESAEFRLQTEQMGRSLSGWLAQRGPTWQNPGPAGTATAALPVPPSFPVAFGLAGARTTADVTEIGEAYAFAWSENQVQAAVKAVPLGQSAGQRILETLATLAPEVVTRATALTDTTRQAFTPMLAILSAQHETQYSRLFRS